MIHQHYALMLFGPGVRYVPEVVWHSKFFWIALLVMVVGILLYHNIFVIKMANGNPINRLRNFFTGNTGPKILYDSQGREGYVRYKSADTQFAMYYEFGGGNCITTIDIPSPDDWEKHTGLPLARRDEVLNFIGQQVVKDHTTGSAGYFKIEENSLNIYV